VANPGISRVVGTESRSPPLSEGVSARVTAWATVLVLVLTYLILAANVGWAPFRRTGQPVAAATAPSRQTRSPAASRPSHSVTVLGPFGVAPYVEIPAVSPPTSPVTKTVIRGSGPAFTPADALVGNYAVYEWQGSRMAFSTFGQTPVLFSGAALTLISNLLAGRDLGSRVAVTLSASYLYGSAGDPALKIGPAATLVYVVDLIRQFRWDAAASGPTVSDGGGTLPTVTPAAGAGNFSVDWPDEAPPARLERKVLVSGSGPPVTAGELVVVQYIGLDWQNADTFYSSWSRRMPVAFRAGASSPGAIAGLSDGVLGAKVGSRVLLVVPPADGFAVRRPPSGVRRTDTLIVVVDVLGVFS
jgi:peptidylprolyl isomerase